MPRTKQKQESVADVLVNEAQQRGYLTITGSEIVYHCRRNYRDNWHDPEEKVRAHTYSWLIIEKSYSPDRIDLEVKVPRRTPSDRADIVVYEDDACRTPFLVVENKSADCTFPDQLQAIEQGFGNANSLRAKYMLFDYGKAGAYFDVQNFPPAERTKNRLGGSESVPANYGTPSQFPLIAQGETDIVALGPSELETKVRRAHGLIWAGGKRDPLKSFDEWSKLLFAKIYDERHTPNGQPRRFQCGVGETATQIANRIRELYAEARRRDVSIFIDEHINLPDDKIRDVAQVIQNVGLSLMSVDALGHAFEHFFSSIFRGDLGQYFTRRELVRFMVAMVRPTDRDVVIDPTCGSGGFLLETLLQVWHYIDRNYRGQTDINRRKYDFAHDNVFGIEIHEILGRVCQTNLLLHQDGHTNIETDNSALALTFKNPRLRADGTMFTVALGNPPFGDKVKAGDTDVLGDNDLTLFEMGKVGQVKSELIILERAFQMLQPGGRLAMVIPDGILNNAGEGSQCPAFRRFLLKTARIDALVSLPDYAFRKSGAQNKTSILFATKFTRDELEQFQVAYYAELGRLREEIEDKDNGHTQAEDDDELADGEDELQQVVVDEDDEEAPDADSKPIYELTELEMQERALAAAAECCDYPMFLAETDYIGYTPTGLVSDKNDLYSMEGERPNTENEKTILGQYFHFRQSPNTYTGTTNPQCMTIKASALLKAHPTYRMDPKFHLFERERFKSPPSGMKLIRLGNVLKRRLERVDPTEEPDTEFLVPTLSIYGELTPREAGLGNNPPAWYGEYFTPGSEWFRIHTDDLLYSGIDLWKGCVTVVSEDFNDAIVTREFPVYEVDKEQLDPHYLKLVLRSSYFQRAIRAITTGHSNRRRTQPYDLKNLTIFVPEDKDVQVMISDMVRAHSQAVADKRSDYQNLLATIDKLIIGAVRPEEILVPVP